MEKPRVLFLDDDAERHKNFKPHCLWARFVWTAQEAITALVAEEFDIVFLDHDLGGEIYVNSDRPDTGMEVARWISTNKPKIGQVIVHSFNPDGRRDMVRLLRKHGYDASPLPFVPKDMGDVIKQWECNGIAA